MLASKIYIMMILIDFFFPKLRQNSRFIRYFFIIIVCSFLEKVERKSQPTRREKENMTKKKRNNKYRK